MEVAVESFVNAPFAKVWSAYTTHHTPWRSKSADSALTCPARMRRSCLTGQSSFGFGDRTGVGGVCAWSQPYGDLGTIRNGRNLL